MGKRGRAPPTEAELNELLAAKKDCKAAWKANKDDDAVVKAYKKARKDYKVAAKLAGVKVEDEDGPSGAASGDAAAGQVAAAGTKLKLSNMSYDIDEAKLKEVIGEYDLIEWGEDPKTGKFNGSATVTFGDSALGAAALACKQKEVLGRKLRIEEVKEWATVRGTPNPDSVDRCFIGNLAYDIDEETLVAAFAEVSIKLEHVFWVTDKESGEFYGSSFCTFATPADAARAVACSGMPINGRACKIGFSAHRNGRERSTKKEGSKGNREKTPRPEGGTHTCFFGNLPYEIDDEKLKEFVSGCGDVKTIRWVLDKATGAFRGAGFIDFWTVEAVDKCIELNGQQLMGRPVRCDYG